MAAFMAIPSSPRFQDLSGKTFGLLTVLGYAGRSKNRESMWQCSCQCGGETVAGASNLKAGRHRSCGCQSTKNGRRFVDQRKDDIPEYRIWSGMKTRCSNQNRHCYKNYGGRGISVCPQWLESFDAFYRDMGPRPTARHTLERIDNDKGYEPGNVYWATYTEQAQNRRNVNRITYAGETLTMTGWAKRMGLTRSALKYRLRVRGCDLEKALTTPLQGRSSERKF